MIILLFALGVLLTLYSLRDEGRGWAGIMGMFLSIFSLLYIVVDWLR